MRAYVLTIKKGCCNVCAETTILGVFTRIALVNKYIRERSIYGLVAQFTGDYPDIELEDADHGVVTLAVTKTIISGL